MASHSQPRLAAFIANGTIVAGHAVKFDTVDDQKVIECTSSTDKAIGIADNSASALQKVVVQLPGGGGKAIAHTTITRGQLVVPYTDGTVQKVSGANDRLVGVAMATAAAGDMIPLEVISGQATATES